MKKIIIVSCLMSGVLNFGYSITTESIPTCSSFLSKLLSTAKSDTLSKVKLENCTFEEFENNYDKDKFPVEFRNNQEEKSFYRHLKERDNYAGISNLYDMWKWVRFNRGFLEQQNEKLFHVYDKLNEVGINPESLDSMSYLNLKGINENINALTESINPSVEAIKYLLPDFEKYVAAYEKLAKEGDSLSYSDFKKASGRGATTANIQQIDQRILHQFRKEMHMNTANTAAMSSLNFGNGYGVSVGAAIGGHKGQYSLALGTAYTDYQTQVNVKIALPVKQPKPSNITYGVGFVYNFQ